MPYLLGFFSALLTLYFNDEIFGFAMANGWKIDEAYSAIAGLASVLAGFLGVFYGLVIAKTSEFMQRLEGHPSFVSYTHQLKVSMMWAAVVAIITVPLVVVKPIPGDYGSIARWVVAFWFGIVVTMLALAWRSASQFFILVEPIQRKT